MVSGSRARPASPSEIALLWRPPRAGRVRRGQRAPIARSPNDAPAVGTAARPRPPRPRSLSPLRRRRLARTRPARSTDSWRSPFPALRVALPLLSGLLLRLGDHLLQALKL